MWLLIAAHAVLAMVNAIILGLSEPVAPLVPTVVTTGLHDSRLLAFGICFGLVTCRLWQWFLGAISAIVWIMVSQSVEECLFQGSPESKNLGTLVQAFVPHVTVAIVLIFYRRVVARLDWRLCWNDPPFRSECRCSLFSVVVIMTTIAALFSIRHAEEYISTSTRVLLLFETTVYGILCSVLTVWALLAHGNLLFRVPLLIAGSTAVAIFDHTLVMHSMIHNYLQVHYVASAVVGGTVLTIRSCGYRLVRYESNKVIR